MPVGWDFSFSLKYFDKNNDNCIKIKILYKFNKIKWLHLPTLTIDNDNT